MVWGCFSLKGTGPLHRIDGRMDAEMYKTIIKDVYLPWARKVHGRKAIFQQDRDPKHTSHLVQDFFSVRKMTVLDWPSQSPDLIPIENLWEESERHVQQKNATSKHQKFEILKEEWAKIDLDTLKKLVESMPARCADVLRNKGYPIKY